MRRVRKWGLSGTTNHGFFIEWPLRKQCPECLLIKRLFPGYEEIALNESAIAEFDVGWKNKGHQRQRQDLPGGVLAYERGLYRVFWERLLISVFWGLGGMVYVKEGGCLRVLLKEMKNM